MMKIEFNNSVSLNKQRVIKDYIEKYLEPIALDEYNEIGTISKDIVEKIEIKVNEWGKTIPGN